MHVRDLVTPELRTCAYACMRMVTHADKWLAAYYLLKADVSIFYIDWDVAIFKPFLHLLDSVRLGLACMLAAALVRVSSLLLSFRVICGACMYYPPSKPEACN